MIRLYAVCWKDTGWPPQPDQEFRAGDGQALAGPDVKRNALPAPGMDLEPQSRKRLCLRIGRDSLLRSISAKLSANYIVLAQRRDRFQDFDLLIPDGLTVRPDGRLHRQVRQDLKQMILHYVADGAGLIVESAAALDSEIFGHSDLNALDMSAVQQGFQKRICETRIEHSVDWAFAQVVVDAKNGLLLESAEQNRIQSAR